MDDFFLPFGFALEVEGDTTSLRLGGVTLAFAVPVTSAADAAWRICFRPDQLGMAYRFTATEAGARRFMAAYAWKREDALRKLAATTAARRQA